MAKQHAMRGQSQALRRFNILTPAFHQRRTAHRARIIGPFHQHERDHHIHDALAQKRQDHECGQNGREGKLQIHQAHDHAIGPPTGIGREQTKRCANQAGNQRGTRTNGQRNPQAVDDARQHIAPLIIRAQQKGEAGTTHRTGLHPAIHDVKFSQIIRVLRRDPRREDGEQGNDDEHHQPTQRHLAFGEFGHEAPKRRFHLIGNFGGEDSVAHVPLLSSRTRGSSIE